MFQIENEYGSYGEDKAYLKALKMMMDEFGITSPYFTSDGPWQATLRAGSLIEEDVFVTGNFGSKGTENFQMMQAFFDLHHKKWPLMSMEFWDGWFNRWGDSIIKRDPQELVDSVMKLSNKVVSTYIVSWWHQLWFYEWLFSAWSKRFAASDVL